MRFTPPTFCKFGPAVSSTAAWLRSRHPRHLRNVLLWQTRPLCPLSSTSPSFSPLGASTLALSLWVLLTWGLMGVDHTAFVIHRGTLRWFLPSGCSERG